MIEHTVCAAHGVELHEGDEAELSCHVTYGGPATPDVYFEVEGSSLTETTFDEDGSTIAITTNFTTTWQDDTRLYECHVRSSRPHYHDVCYMELDVIRELYFSYLTPFIPSLD